jgi:hypothetical protein
MRVGARATKLPQLTRGLPTRDFARRAPRPPRELHWPYIIHILILVHSKMRAQGSGLGATPRSSRIGTCRRPHSLRTRRALPRKAAQVSIPHIYQHQRSRGLLRARGAVVQRVTPTRDPRRLQGVPPSTTNTCPTHRDIGEATGGWARSDAPPVCAQREAAAGAAAGGGVHNRRMAEQLTHSTHSSLQVVKLTPGAPRGVVGLDLDRESRERGGWVEKGSVRILFRSFERWGIVRQFG